MGDLGFFAEDFPQWKMAQEPTVPAATVPVPQWDGAPAAAPAAPAVSPDELRRQQLTGALDNAFVDGKPLDTADARILTTTPYVDPLKGQGTVAGFGGQTISKSVGGNYLSPEAKQAAARAETQSGKAADAKIAEGQLAMQQAQEFAAQKEQQAQALQNKAAQDLAKQDAIRKRADDAIVQGQKYTDEFLKAQSEVDPNRTMKGGRGIMAAVAAGLGAFGSGLTGTPNSALQIIENGIARDWQAQKDAVEGKKYKAEASGRLVAQLRNSLSDEQSVQLAHNAALKEALAAKMDGLATKMKGTEAAAQSVTVSEQLRAGAAQARAELLARETIHASTTTATNIVPVTKVSPVMNALEATDKQAKLEHDIAANRGQLPEGEARTSQENVKKDVAAGLNILRPLNALRKDLKSSAGAGMDASISLDATKRDQLRQMVKIAVGKMVSGAAMSEEEGMRIERAIFGQRVFSSDALDEVVKTYSNFLATDLKTKVDLLHPKLKDATWADIQSATDEDEFRVLKSGKYDSASGKAAEFGGTVRDNKPPSREDRIKTEVGRRMDSK